MRRPRLQRPCGRPGLRSIHSYVRLLRNCSLTTCPRLAEKRTWSVSPELVNVVGGAGFMVVGGPEDGAMTAISSLNRRFLIAGAGILAMGAGACALVLF